MKTKHVTSSFKPASKAHNQHSVLGQIVRDYHRPGYGYIGEFSRANCKLQCPFCYTANTVFVWSLAGSGKRCIECRAMLASFSAFITHTPETSEASGYNQNQNEEQ